MNILGFTGRAKSGKDTTCRIATDICSRYGVKTATLAFATPLKQLCADILGRAYNVPPEAFYGTQEDKDKPLTELPGWTGRKIMQHIGTEGFRFISPDLWARLLYNDAQKILKTRAAQVVFVSDVRFLSEASIIQSNGGKVARIKRPSVDSVFSTGFTNHASEQELVHITEDYTLNNQDGPMHGLVEKTEKMLRQFRILP